MSVESAAPAGPSRIAVIAFAALVAGAVAMAISPVFVRYAEVGPFTSAFYRVFLALPLLWAWSRLEAGGADAIADPGWTRGILLCGLFFAADLLFWHLSILKTTIANATLLATMAPVWVMLFSGLFIGEKVTRTMAGGLVLCIAGACVLVGSSYSLTPARFVGDLYGLATSFFFGLYFLALRVARRNASAGLILFRSSLISSVCLAGVALVMENSWLPGTLAGAAALVAMSSISHVGGQGLLAFALGHLSAAFSSLVIFLEALAGALFGWVFFAETVGALQVAGGAAILAGIWVARPRQG